MSGHRSVLKALTQQSAGEGSGGDMKALRAWMKAHGFSTSPGCFTMFLHSPVHKSARSAAVRALRATSKRPR